MSGQIRLFKMLLNNLQKDKKMSYETMEEGFTKLRQAIAKQKCTWDDLGTTEAKFAVLELNCFGIQLNTVVSAHTKARNCVKKLAYNFKNGEYNDNTDMAKQVAEIIIKAVNMGLITWNELNLTQKYLVEALANMEE